MPELKWRGALPDDGSADLDALAEGKAVAAEEALTARDGTTGRAVVIQSDNRLRASGSVFRLKKAKGPFEEYDPNMMSARGSRQPFASLKTPAWQKALPYAVASVVAVVALFFFITAVLPRLGDALGSLQLPALSSAAAPQATAPATSGDQPQIAITFVAPQAAETAAPVVVGTAAPVPTVAPLPGGGVQLALDARERAWVRVKIDGNVVFEGIPPAGPGTPYNANESVQIETGNAGAFDVILNGTRLGPLGARNETVSKTYGVNQ